MKDEEIIVQKLFFERYKINLKRIQETNVKTPDFECTINGEKIFVMELKTLKRVRPSEETGWKEGRRGGWMKKDENPRKIANLLKKAHPQLEKYKEPKILTYLKDTSDYDFRDLKSALTKGNITLLTTQETLENLYNHVAIEKIEEKKNYIDLYIWIDVPKNYKIDFLPTNDIGKKLYNQYFIKT